MRDSAPKLPCLILTETTRNASTARAPSKSQLSGICAFAATLSIENPFASCAADPVGITKRDPLNYCTATEELWCDWWTIEKGLDNEYKSSLYWEPSCSESSQINLCKPGSTCDSKEESDTPAENCIFNPSCFCLMDSLQGLGGGGGGSCTPNY